MKPNFAGKAIQFIPKGVTTLFIIQIFFFINFNLLYSTLSPYLTNILQMDDNTAINLMASFMTLSYIMYIFSGFIAGRYLSYRLLFIFGACLQIIACILASWPSMALLYVILATFLAGSSLSLICIYCMLAQSFKPEDKRREIAFLCSYSSMGIGVLTGSIISHYFQTQQNYHALFLLSIFCSAATILMAIIKWRKLIDRSTYVMALAKDKRLLTALKGTLLILVLLFILQKLLHHDNTSQYLMATLGTIVIISIILFAMQQPISSVRNRMWAYLILALFTVYFMTLYWLGVTMLPFFIAHNVISNVLDKSTILQWYQKIEALTFIIGGPILSITLHILRRKGHGLSIPTLFATSLFLLGISFTLLPIGISVTNTEGYIHPSWLLVSYSLQALAQLFILPIGFAMLGQLIPSQLQSIMIGIWLMLTGLAVALTNRFSSWIFTQKSQAILPTATSQYHHYFDYLGWAAIIFGIVLILLTRSLNKLIKYKSLDPTLN